MSNPMRQTILLVDDDRYITDALTMALECEGRTIVVCEDTQSADVALDHFPITDVITDIQFSGPFKFEGLRFLEGLRDRLPRARIAAMTGCATDRLRSDAMIAGATAMLAKPFDLGNLERVIGRPDGGGSFDVVRLPAIDELLRYSHLSALFQPIIRMTSENAVPFAFEALTRPVCEGWSTAGPAALFEYAARCGRTAELNRTALRVAIHAAADLPARALVFINVDPETFSDPALVVDVLTAAATSGVAPERIVLEITERTALRSDFADSEVFETLRRRGIRFALDDHGPAYSKLATISTIRPSFIKISNLFGTGFEVDATKLRLVRHVSALARDFGCATVLEGIESRATADAAAELGIELVQGYFFGRPQSVSHWRQMVA